MLRRVRIGFALLAAVLLATLGFLILRTLATLDRERELEHAAVANRVFDEAEGALADFLRAEQARPVAAYREQPSGVPWMDERPDFVRAYFEIDDRGAIRTSAGEPGLEAEIRKAADAGLTRLGEVADASPMTRRMEARAKWSCRHRARRSTCNRSTS